MALFGPLGLLWGVIFHNFSSVILRETRIAIALFGPLGLLWGTIFMHFSLVK